MCLLREARECLSCHRIPSTSCLGRTKIASSVDETFGLVRAPMAGAAEGKNSMPNSLIIGLCKYAVYVKILAGQGDGPLIYVDEHGNMEAGDGDPGPLTQRLQAAVKQIEAGVGALHEAVGLMPRKA
jgi:hypothetical protein